MNGLHQDKRSLKDLAELVIMNSSLLPIYRFYEIAAERLVDTERAERLLIETKTEIDARNAATNNGKAATQ